MTSPQSHPPFLKPYFKRIGLLLLLYSALRLAFLLRNHDYFSPAPSALELLEAFALGLRFDLSAILLTCLPFTLLSLWPTRLQFNQTWQKTLKLLFLLPNFAFLLLALVDIEFYRFTDRRTTNEIFDLTPEIRDQMIRLLWDYAQYTIAGIVTLWGFARIYPSGPDASAEPSTAQSPARLRHFWKSLLIIPSLLALNLLGIRGTLQVRPLSSGHAFRFSTPAMGNLALNSPFVFQKSLQESANGGVATRRNDFPTLHEAVAAMPPHQKRTPSHAAPAKKDNLILIIVESFNSELAGFENPALTLSNTPFLDSLAAKGRAFTRHYANSKRSITALPAILLSFPDWLPTAFSTSVYQGNRFHGLGSALREQGYATWFFHGTRPGTMTFDIVSRVAGIENYYTLREYGDYPPEDHDQTWGLYDDIMLKRVGNVLSTTDKPFAAVVFTLSSHQPQKVDPRYHERFGKQGPAASIRYVDHAISEFFRRSEKEPWFKDTLFVITGDHTHDITSPGFQTALGRYDVPLIFFHPSRRLPAADTRKIVNQIDITPSILDLMGFDTSRTPPFAHSVFEPGHPGQALLRAGDTPSIVTANGSTAIDAGGTPRYYEIRDTELRKLEAPSLAHPSDEQRLRAYLQFFNNALIENRWSTWNTP